VIRCAVCGLVHLAGRCFGSREAQEADAQSRAEAFRTDIPPGPPIEPRRVGKPLSKLTPRDPPGPTTVRYRSRRGFRRVPA
jgi:hypothetical protein